MKRILIKRTVVGWFNLYCDGELMANVPRETMLKLIPSFNVNCNLASYDLDLEKVFQLGGRK